jgi:hypothetical protein
MSTPTTTSPIVLSCKDSPLSTTSNVLGILTFAAAACVSVLLYVDSIRSANKRFKDMVEGLELRYREADHVRGKLEAGQRIVRYGRPSQVDHQRIEMALGRTMEPLREAMNVLEQLRGHGLRRRGTMDFQGRVRFVMKEDAVQDLLSRVEKAVEVLREVANDVLEQYVNSLLRLSAQDLY